MPGGGDFCVVFLTRGPEFCAGKLSRGSARERGGEW